MGRSGSPRRITGTPARRPEGTRPARRPALWHQGESDFATDAATYAANVRSVIAQVRAAYPDARFYVAQTSLCTGMPSRPETLAAQAGLVDGVQVVAGPNTDRYDAWGDRYDGCHFSSVGARKVARDWAALINAEFKR